MRGAIDSEVLELLRAHGEQWALYEHKDLECLRVLNVNGVTVLTAGEHKKFLKFGPGCLYKYPPERFPDTGTPNWEYCIVGIVDLMTGDIR